MSCFSILTGGALSLTEPILKLAIDECSPENCTIVGLETPIYRARGYFLTTTTSEKPYCGRCLVFII